MKIPENLQTAIRENKLVFFIGAGTSIPLNFPSWKELIKTILSELNTKYGETSDLNFQNVINGINSGSKSLFEALNKIENDTNGLIYKKQTKETIYNIIKSLSNSLPRESEIHSKIWAISDKIITTNYDRVLEKFSPNLDDVNIFNNDNVFQILKTNDVNSRFLYKIHGDYQNPDTITLFESDYKDIYNNDDYNADALATFFKNSTLLFIGFSLTDPFVNDLFSKIKKIYNNYTVNNHFVFTTKDEDFSKYDITTIKINDWSKSLLTYLNELEKLKLSNTKNYQAKISKKDELSDNDIKSIYDLIAKKSDLYMNNPSNKDLLKEIKDLRLKLDNLLYGEIDYMQEVSDVFRNTGLQLTFDTIYSTEKLNTSIFNEIQNIRNNKDTYKWFDRSVIVSAVTCSLIHFNKPDERKISILIDFINDNEEKVWQKSLTSLFMVLNHLGNKWLRFPSIKSKIKSLNNNLEVQNACILIIQSYSLGINNFLMGERLFKNPYFSDNAYNYFLPYHEDENPEFEKIYDNYNGNDIEKFILFIKEVPIPDQMKYLMCSESKGNTKDVKKNTKASEKLKNIILYNGMFYPYSVYIQEIINFYKYFPVYRHQEKLKSQLKLSETPLKDYLLNEKEKYSSLGLYFMSEKNWAQSIVNYNEALKYDQNNLLNLLNLATCYNNQENFKKELETRLKILVLDGKNENNLICLAENYFDYQKDYIKAFEIVEKLVFLNNQNADYYNIRGSINEKLKKYKEALADYDKAISLNNEVFNFYCDRGYLYLELNHYKKALEDWNLAIKLKPCEEFYFKRSEIYYQILDFENSIKDLDNAISLNSKSAENYLQRGIIKAYSSNFDDAIKDIKIAERLGLDNDLLFGAYANYWRLFGNFDIAFEYLEKLEKIKLDFISIGTKATIYASMNNNDKFYFYLEEAFKKGGEAKLLFIDIKKKYENEAKFIKLLNKYDQKIEEIVLL